MPCMFAAAQVNLFCLAKILIDQFSLWVYLSMIKNLVLGRNISSWTCDDFSVLLDGTWITHLIMMIPAEYIKASHYSTIWSVFNPLDTAQKHQLCGAHLGTGPLFKFNGMEFSIK